MPYGKVAQEMLRILYCAGPSRFNEIWGEELGPKLWANYQGLSPNRGRFLAELTSLQADILGEYTATQLGLKPAMKFDPSSIGNVLGADEG